jgi:predicted nucleic acid-binding protein
MPALVDTNVLLAAASIFSPHHDIAVAALRRLSGGRGRISPQVAREFYGVATRAVRAHNSRPGLGFALAETLVMLDAFRSEFPLISEDADVVTELARLARLYNVSGKQIHDANLVATAKRHRMARIVTLNLNDFRKFSGEIAIQSPENA